MGTRAPTALLVEDDLGLLAMLRRHLERGGFVVAEAATEREAVSRAEVVSPDVIILDLALAEGSGDAACARLRAHRTLSDVPILVLSARDDVATKVGLLTIGADDYVVKPCDPDELIARMRRLISRRATGLAVRRIGRLRVSLGTGDAWVGESAIDLTAGERAVLTELARNWPATTPRAALDQAPWRMKEPAMSNVTEVLVTRLRRKLAAAASGVEIQSIRRLGYALRTTRAEGGTNVNRARALIAILVTIALLPALGGSANADVEWCDSGSPPPNDFRLRMTGTESETSSTSWLNSTTGGDLDTSKGDAMAATLEGGVATGMWTALANAPGAYETQVRERGDDGDDEDSDESGDDDDGEDEDDD